MKRQLSVACAALGVLGLVVAGCGSGGTASEAPENSSPSSASGYPVTIKHMLGTMTIPKEPERIVALGTPGSTELDTLVGLGIEPVGAPKNPGSPDGNYPWLQGKFDIADVAAVDALNVNVEQIASLQPDLVLAVNFGVKPDVYSKLSQIAPTVGNIAPAGSASWQDKTMVVGKAVGREAQAKDLVAGTEAVIAAIPRENPGLAGKTFSVSYVFNGGVASAVKDADGAVKLFKQMGMKVAPTLAEESQRIAPNNPGVMLSMENIDKLDADVVVIGYQNDDLKRQVESSGLFKDLRAVKSGGYAGVDLQTISTLRGTSVLNIPWVLERIKPALVKGANSTG